METLGIHHYSVRVTDMERAVTFYQDILGMQEIEIPVTFPPAGAHVRWLKVGQQHIHLMPTNQADVVSPRHIALQVANTQKARAFLIERGVAFREELLIPGADRISLADPDGNNIELIEWQEPYHNNPVAD